MRPIFRRVSIALSIVLLTVAFVSARQATMAAGKTTTRTATQGTPPKTPPPPPTAAKAASTSPITDSIKSTYDMAKDFLTKSAQQFAEKDYTFKPAGVAPEVRNVGQLIGHIANANFMLCSAGTAPVKPAGTPEKMAEEKGPGGVDYEKTTAKVDLQKALAESFVVCDKSFTLVNDRNGGQPVTGLPIGPTTKLGSLAFNNAHLMEHYGNIVTYMRVKGMVPPSTQAGR